MSEIQGRTLDEVTEIANKLGLLVVLPQEDEIILDIDSPDGTMDQKVRGVILSNSISFLGILWTRSKSGNRHCYIKLSRRLPVMERLILMACLGSDPTHVCLSMFRETYGGEINITAFETPKEAARISKWRNGLKYYGGGSEGVEEESL